MNIVMERCVQAIMATAVKIAPPDRHIWAQAMMVELEHVPDSEAVTFALGCMGAMARARVVTTSFILGAAQWVLVIGAAIWSALNLWLAGRLSQADAAAPAMFAYSGAALFAAGSLVTAWLGTRATIRLAAPLLIVAMLFVISAEFIMPPTPHQNFYRALVIEDAFMLLMALAVAIGVPQWVSKRKVNVR